MKKRILFLCVIFILLIWIILVFADSQRLENQTNKTAPIISVFEKTTDEEIVYYGLGYSVHYELSKDNSVTGSTFYLFYSIVLWGWTE